MAHSFGSWQWQQWRWTLHQWSTSLCHSPCRVFTQGWNMHLILKPSTLPPATAWSDTHSCCKWGSYGTHTTFWCPSLTSWCCSFLAASMGYLGSPHLSFFVWSSDLQIQSLASSVWTSTRFWQRNSTSYWVRKCWETPSLPGCIYVDSYDIWVPDVAQNLW